MSSIYDDDINWPDSLYVLAKRAGMDISKEEVDSMSSEQSVNCCVVIQSQQLDISRRDLESSLHSLKVQQSQLVK